MTESARPRIDVGEAFAGRSILLLGGTGFLGKVCLGMLLEFFPEIRRVYLMVRAAGEAESRVRFEDIMANSPALSPLRERHGTGLRGFLDEKIVVLGGDITSDNLGYAEARAAEIAADIDLVLNCSGRVTFNPSLEAALQTNVHGTRNTIAFARRMKRPALVHISTCFVAGMRSGEVREDEPLIGYFPRRDREDQEFSVEKEIEDCERLAARVRDEAEDKSRVDAFQEAARKRFAEEGRDPDDARSLSLAIARERKEWIRRRLRDLGIEKAQGWGWPNIYTYTKSLGDQLVAGAEGVARSIVRPAVVESALSFPHTGWNEGFTTSAPLVRMALRGQNLFPVGPGVVLDVVPVDLVASATLAVAAETIVSEPHLVYQVSSGDRNPARVERLVDIVGIYKRRHFRDKPTGVKLWNEALARMEAQAVFIVGHELIHRRRQWERRLGEFLLASASYPQYATEHVYIHHAFVGTPLDVGSAPRGESLWHYFPREVANNLLGSWRVARERLARKGLPAWHRSNPFWRRRASRAHSASHSMNETAGTSAVAVSRLCSATAWRSISVQGLEGSRSSQSSTSALRSMLGPRWRTHLTRAWVSRRCHRLTLSSLAICTGILSRSQTVRTGSR